MKKSLLFVLIAAIFAVVLIVTSCDSDYKIGLKVVHDGYSATEIGFLSVPSSVTSFLSYSSPAIVSATYSYAGFSAGLSYTVMESSGSYYITPDNGITKYYICYSLTSNNKIRANSDLTVYSILYLVAEN